MKSKRVHIPQPATTLDLSYPFLSLSILMGWTTRTVESEQLLQKRKAEFDSRIEADRKRKDEQFHKNVLPALRKLYHEKQTTQTSKTSA